MRETAALRPLTVSVLAFSTRGGDRGESMGAMTGARASAAAAALLLAGLVCAARAGAAAGDGVRGGEPTVMPPADSFEGFEGGIGEAAPETAEKFTFQAEVNRLMDIIINSLYSNRDVFLRELISNASDALDKLRFMALSGDGEGGAAEAVDDEGLVIRVSGDEEAGVLTIMDTGVGMTREELIANLGTIAKSGTSSFLDRLGAAAKEAAVAKDADAASNLIGQFGVGFYSAYLVADRVRVESRVLGGGVNVWESSADGKFVVFEGDATKFGEERGTKISLVMKDDAKNYLDQAHLESLIKKYSQFINFPIFLRTETAVVTPIEKPEADGDADTDAAEGEEKKDDAEDEIEVKDDDEDKDELESKEDVQDTKTENVVSWELMNKNKPIWTRDPSEIDESEYKMFYDGIARLPGAPMARSHFKGEGEVEFKSILYIPDKPPVGLYSGHGGDLEKDAIRLYVRRVLVTDTFEDGLLPRYLAFLVGIVDSDDLPINVSREMLQKSKTLETIRRKLVRKALEMMKSLVKQEEAAEKEAEEGGEEEGEKDGEGEEGEEGEDAEGKKSEDDKKKVTEKPYLKFWKLYGKSIKLGVIEDQSNRARLAKLLRFQTSKSGDEFVSLDRYLDGMKEDQDHVYYHSGETIEDIKSSPFLEKLISKGYEVLFLTEPIDEHMIMNLPDYEGTKFMSVAKDGFKYGEKDQKEEKEKTDALKKQYRPLTKFLKKRLASRVSKVKLSSRLSDTPCVLSSEQHGYSARMEIVMKAQAFADPDSFSYMAPKTKIMELNPHHMLVRKMLEYAKEATDRDGDAAKEAGDRAEELGNLIYDTALISGGYLVHDTADYSKRMYKWISNSVGVDPDAKVEDVVPEPESADEEQDPEDLMEKLADMPGMDGASVMSREEVEAKMKSGDMNFGGEAPPHDEL